MNAILPKDLVVEINRRRNTLMEEQHTLLKDIRTLDEILATLGHKKGQKNPKAKANRRPRGSSFRLDPVILGIKGEWAVDDAASKLVHAKLIKDTEDRSELSNAISRLVKAGKVLVVKEGKGRAKAAYKSQS